MYIATMRNTLIVLLFAAVVQVKAISLGFGEIDYQASESQGGRNFVIQKNDETVGDLVVIVTTLLYSEIDPSEIPDEITSLPDPAEFDPDGKQDFERVVKTITFPPSLGNTDLQVFIQFKDDNINEETEGFWVQVRVNETASDPKDLEKLEYIRNGLALAVINDDDDIKLTFEKPEYTVSENAGEQNDLITILKQDNGTTERTLEVFVQLNPLSGNRAATPGEDFVLNSTLISISVPPEMQEFNIPFEVKDDEIAEDVERFNIFLSVPQNGDWLVGSVPNTNVFFSDDDEAVVGFETPEYFVNEGDENVEVCIILFSPSQIDLFVLGTISTKDDQADAEADYVPLNQVEFFIEDGQRRTCYQITIVDDNETEGTESFTISITPDELFTPPNVRVAPNITTIIVMDNDVIEAPSCDRCDSNADCVSGLEGENTCVCMTGYTGDGETCTDIDECTLDIDGCSRNARCINTPGSFQCQCNSGYNGDGFTCEDINECDLGIGGCSQDAVCINTPGSFRCKCNRGFTGDGFTCNDNDECALERDRCSDKAVCINVPGSYRCQCNEGFEGNGIICKDINECFKQKDKCSENGWCTNTVGSYQCTCREGFAGDGLSCIPQQDEPLCDDESDEGTPKTKHTHTRTHTHGHSRTGKSKHTKSRSTNPDPVNDDGILCDENVQQDEEENTRTKPHTRTPNGGTPRTPGHHKTHHHQHSHVTPRRNGHPVNDQEASLPTESTKSKSSKRRNHRPVASDEGQQAKTPRHTTRHTPRHGTRRG